MFIEFETVLEVALFEGGDVVTVLDAMLLEVMVFEEIVFEVIVFEATVLDGIVLELIVFELIVFEGIVFEIWFAGTVVEAGFTVVVVVVYMPRINAVSWDMLPLDVMSKESLVLSFVPIDLLIAV